VSVLFVFVCGNLIEKYCFGENKTPSNKGGGEGEVSERGGGGMDGDCRVYAAATEATKIEEKEEGKKRRVTSKNYR
jgi:hypothetical protein